MSRGTSARGQRGLGCGRYQATTGGAKILILARLLPRWVTLGKLFNISEPQFPSIK